MTYANNICSTCVKVYECTYMCMMGSCTLLTKPGCLFFRQSSKGYAHYTQSKALGHTWNCRLGKVGNAVVLWCQCWLAKSCSRTLQCKMLTAFSKMPRKSSSYFVVPHYVLPHGSFCMLWLLKKESLSYRLSWHSIVALQKKLHGPFSVTG